MVRRIDTEAIIHSIRLQEQVGTPSTPSTGYSNIFAKADGLYIVDDAGAVTGPFGEAGAGGGKPYATIVVAASDSIAADAASADYVCDGTDDQVQINAALAACTVGGTILLLEGLYVISDSIEFAANNTTLQGQGYGSIIRLAAGLTLATNFAMVDYTGQYAGCAIKDLQLDGNYRAYNTTGSPYQQGISLTGFDNFTLSGCLIHDHKYNSVAFSTQTYDVRNRVTIVNTVFTSSDTRTGYPIYHCNLYNMSAVISGNQFSQASQGLYSSDALELIVSGNNFHDQEQYGLQCWYGRRTTVVGNTVYNFQDVGISVGEDVEATVVSNSVYSTRATSYGIEIYDAVVIANNYVEVAVTTPYALYVDSVDNGSLVGNVLVGGEYGLLLDTVRYTTVTGNQISGSNWSGIWMDLSDVCVLSGNLLFQNNVSGLAGVAQLYLFRGCDDNLISSNRVHQGASTVAYGVRLNTHATPNTNNVVVGNDLRNSGTTPLQDGATGTVLTYPAGSYGDNFG